MGVDHGGPGDKSPRIWSKRTLMQIVPSNFVIYCRYKKERSVAFKIRQNLFSAGALPRTPLGNWGRSPDPLVGWRGNTPPHTYTTRHRHKLSWRVFHMLNVFLLFGNTAPKMPDYGEILHFWPHKNYGEGNCQTQYIV